MTPPTGLWTTWTARYRRIRQRVWARRGIDLAVLAALVFGLGAWQTRTHLSSGELPAAVLTTLVGERVSASSPGSSCSQRAGTGSFEVAREEGR